MYYYSIKNELYIADKEYYIFPSIKDQKEFIIDGNTYSIIYLNSKNKNIDPSIKGKDTILVETFDKIYFVKKCQLASLKKRIFENLDYQLLCLIDNESEFFFAPSSDKVILTLIKSYRTNDSGKILVYDKFLSNVSWVKLVEYPKKKSKRFNHIELKDAPYSYEGTGLSFLQNDILEEKIIGPLSPIYYLEENKQSFSDFNAYVVKSYSGREIDENEYSIHGGKGDSITQAKNSAYGEACERYSSRLLDYDNKELIVGTYSELCQKFKVINPNRLFLDKDYPNIYSDEKIFEWVNIYNITKKETILFPANSIFFPYNRPLKLMMHSQSTTGLSAERNLELAILKGIFEVLERDAYAISFRAKVPGKKIIINNIKDNYLLEFLKFYEGKGFKFHIQLLNSLPFIYVVHVTIEQKNFPVFTHGSSASLNLESAIKRAVFEAFQMRDSQIALEKSKTDKSVYLEWARGNKDYCYMFLDEYAEQIVDVTEMPELNSNYIVQDIYFLIESLKKFNFDVYVANLSRDDIPLKCVKILIPGMQDIDNYLSRITDRLKSKLLERNEKINELELFS